MTERINLVSVWSSALLSLFFRDEVTVFGLERWNFRNSNNATLCDNLLTVLHGLH